MTRHAEYFDDWPLWPLTCSCGWAGTAQRSMADWGASQYLTEYDCPQCQSMVLLVSYPTVEQVELAAAAGNPEAVEMLARVQRQNRYAEQVVTSRLDDASAFPDVAGDTIDVTFRLDEHPAVTEMTVLANGVAIHHEAIHYESLEPLERLVPMLRERYGERLRSIDPTGANNYFLGDRLKSIDEMNAILGPLRNRITARADTEAGQTARSEG